MGGSGGKIWSAGRTYAEGGALGIVSRNKTSSRREAPYHDRGFF